MKTRIFIDYWNFTLRWRERTRKDCDWTKVPTTLVAAAEKALSSAQLGSLTLEETRVYSSYEPGRNGGHKRWLSNFLDRQPGVRVFAAERHWKKKDVHCRACNTKHEFCPQCNSPLGRAAEKGVDTSIVTDMLSLAWEGAYEVALLVSSDKDFIPAVENLQNRNFKVVNACWTGYGHELAKISWASVELDNYISILER